MQKDVSLLVAQQVHIKKCKIAEAHSQNKSQNLSLMDEDLEAFIAVMYARGVSGKNDRPVHSLWRDKWGIPLCKQAMSRNRFCAILRFLRFDYKSTRSERLRTDKLALFCTA